jgi:hypothetical protein
MSFLHDKHPQVVVEFKRGHFTALKTPRKFSSIALDEAHEKKILLLRVVVA